MMPAMSQNTVRIVAIVAIAALVAGSAYQAIVVLFA